MATPESFRPKENGRKESLFPVDRNKAQRALLSISPDPTREFDEEGKNMARGNPELAKFVFEQSEGYLDEGSKRKFLEGAFWTHRILRYNLGTSKNLPRLSDDLCNGLHKVALAESSKSLQDYYAEKMWELTETDPGLQYAMRDFTRYDSNSVNTYFGAYLVAGSFKRYDDFKKLESSIGNFEF